MSIPLSSLADFSAPVHVFVLTPSLPFDCTPSGFLSQSDVVFSSDRHASGGWQQGACILGLGLTRGGEATWRGHSLTEPDVCSTPKQFK